MPLIQAQTFDAPADNAGIAAVFGSCADALASRAADVRSAAAREIDPVSNCALLVAHISFEPDTRVRDIVIDRLVGTRDIEVARPLLGLVRSDNIGLRNAVVAALPLLGEALLPELQSLLDDADPAVRIAAVNVLQGMRGQRVVDLALAAVKDDLHVNVCAAAVDILAEAGGPDAVAPLRALVKRFPDVPFIAVAVAVAIKRIG